MTCTWSSSAASSSAILPVPSGSCRRRPGCAPAAPPCARAGDDPRHVLGLVVGRDDHQDPTQGVEHGLLAGHWSASARSLWWLLRFDLAGDRLHSPIVGRVDHRSGKTRSRACRDRTTRTTCPARGEPTSAAITASTARAASAALQPGGDGHRGVRPVRSGMSTTRLAAVNSAVRCTTVPSRGDEARHAVGGGHRDLAPALHRPRAGDRELLLDLPGAAVGRVVRLHHQHLGAAGQDLVDGLVVGEFEADHGADPERPSGCRDVEHARTRTGNGLGPDLLQDGQQGQQFGTEGNPLAERHEVALVVAGLTDPGRDPTTANWSDARPARDRPSPRRPGSACRPLRRPHSRSAGSAGPSSGRCRWSSRARG